MHGIYLNTNELGRLFGVKGDSIRVHLCRRGSYFGLKPIKAPNGRLLWPADEAERVLRGEPARPGEAA